MAKSPVAGQVKTRLTTGFTPAQAAALAQACLRDTLDTVAATPASRRVVAWEGVRRSWVPAGIHVTAQLSPPRSTDGPKGSVHGACRRPCERLLRQPEERVALSGSLDKFRSHRQNPHNGQ